MVQKFMLNILSGSKDLTIFYNEDKILINEVFTCAQLIKSLPKHLISNNTKKSILCELADIVYSYDSKHNITFNIVSWCIKVKYNNDYILWKYVSDYKINKYYKIVKMLDFAKDENLRRALLENYFHNSYNIKDMLNWLKGQHSYYDELRIAVIKRNMQKVFIKELNRSLGNSNKQYSIFCNNGWVVSKDNYNDKSIPVGQRKIYTIDDFYMHLPEEYQLAVII